MFSISFRNRLGICKRLSQSDEQSVCFWYCPSIQSHFYNGRTRGVLNMFGPALVEGLFFNICQMQPYKMICQESVCWQNHIISFVGCTSARMMCQSNELLFIHLWHCCFYNNALKGVLDKSNQ